MPLSLKSSTSILSSTADTYERFTALLEELSLYLNFAEGIKTVPRSNNDLARNSFASLSDCHKENLFNSFVRFYELCVELSSTHRSLKGNHRLILKHLEREGLSPDKELFDILSRHDFVEVYNMDFIQTFRTLEFFEYTTHTLEDLFLRPYWELYKRSENVEQQIARNAARILNGESNGPMFDFAGETTVREINSPRTILSRINTIVAGPLYSVETGSICGIIHVVDVLNQKEIKLIRAELDTPELRA